MQRVKKVRTLQERLRIIEEIEKNPDEKRVDIAKRLGLAASTLNSIYLKKQELREQIGKCGKSSITRKTSKESKFSELEKILFAWYQQLCAENTPVDGTIIRTKAKYIAEKLGINDFAASNGWISRFKARHGIGYKMQAGEEIQYRDHHSSVNTVQGSLWTNKLTKLLKDYKPGDIYSADETALFYNCLPNGTLQSLSLDTNQMSPDRISVLLCVNSDGTDMREPVVIGKPLEQKYLKHVKKIPVKYFANINALLTTNIFNLFLRDLDAEMRVKGRHILLFIDHCSAHPKDTKYLTNIKVVLYPSDCRLQPFGMGIIKYFKAFYRKNLIQNAISLMDSGVQINTAHLEIEIHQALENILTAWNQVKPSSIIKSFYKAGHSNVASYSADKQVSVPEDNWIRLDIPQYMSFEIFVKFDDNVATCGVETDDIVYDTNLTETTRDINNVKIEPLSTPSFSEAYTAFETLKDFLYSHTITDAEKDTICKTEKLLISFSGHN